MYPVTFRRWRNKGYAVFASLNRVIRIGTLSAVYTMLNLPVLQAQSDTSLTPKIIELEEVELVGEAALVMLTSGLAPVLVISAAEISSSGAKSLDDLLEILPQADLRQRGPFGVQADISMRGGSFDQTLILINGIDFTDPQTGHFNLNLPFDLSVIDHIEVLYGPSATFYGSGAYAGAINIVTVPDSLRQVSAALAGGSFSRWLAYATLHSGGKNRRLLAHLSGSASKGYITSTDYHTGNLYLQGTASRRNISGSVMAGMNLKNFGAASFYSLRFPDQYEETAAVFASQETRIRIGKLPLSLKTGFRINNDHFILERDNPQFYQNYHRSMILSNELGGSFASALGFTRFGLGLRRTSILSTSLGLPLDDPVVSVRYDSISFAYGRSRNELKLTLNHRITLNRLSLSAGAFVYMNGFLSGDPVLYPGGGLRYKLSTNWQVYASVNRSMRLPTFTDLYYHGPQNEGNPELKPERAWTAETGISGGYKALDFTGSVFYRAGREIIDWVWLEDNKWHTLNYTTLETFGAEASVSLQPAKFARPLPVLHKLTLNWSYTGVKKIPGSYTSYYALDFLRNQVGFTADLRPFKNLEMLWRSRFQQRNGSYLSYEPASGENIETAYEPVVVSDLNVMYRAGRITLHAGCGNLFNASYMDFGGLPQPGRWFEAGIAIN
ncbi:MAG: TonB-dependent receptor plug domain-containing protein [Bacteroidota bacterium]